MMADKGAFGEMPEFMDAEGNVIADTELNIEYTGALIQAQKMGQEGLTSEWLSEQVQWATAVGQIDPTRGLEILDNVDFDESARLSARARGVDEKILTDKADREEVRGERAKAQERQQKAEALEKGAGAISQLRSAQNG